ncbi:Histone-lysine N-methyltransferase SETMAR [Dufourea novaeangliae]|uniref:Histone-lysine N-methyltransferase SETMAR n=1 Tax=Dufourea novaeangliae TaxID=178035 RepID=A0A154PLR7_DUFNO|nr:Histone-lysine N-methyltransferase SETMAR [Dufourea novaeangliae]
MDYLQQNNARPCIPHRTLGKIEKFGWERVIHPTYSPDVAPNDYHSFRLLQHSLIGKRFCKLDDVATHLSKCFASK